MVDMDIHQAKEIVNTQLLNDRESSQVTLADGFALAVVLKACATQKNLTKGIRIHADVLKCGFLEINIFVGNSLVSMYSKCDALGKAQQVFDELVDRDVVSWTAIISAYAQHNHGKEALKCWTSMKYAGVSPNVATYASILKACGTIGALEEGKEIHIEVVRNKYLQNSATVIGNALVDMYAKCNDLVKAQYIFDDLTVRNTITWNTLITGYCQHELCDKALVHFKQMKCEGLLPSAVTLASMMKACGNLRLIKAGKEIHIETGMDDRFKTDLVLGNAMVSMYGKCGALVEAKTIFDSLLIRDIISWNALIEGYCEKGYCDETFDLLKHMQDEGLSPDAGTFTSLLKVCGSLKAVENGERVHGEIVSNGRLGDAVVGNAILDMYAKCGKLDMAQKVFNELPVRCVVSWTTLIAGYCEHGYDQKALSLFGKMKQHDLLPDAVVLSCVLKACASLGAAEIGEEVHFEIVRRQLLEHNVVLGCALVHMYAKCGVLSRAQEIFNEVSARSLVSWTALIAGYCNYGDLISALFYFEQMNVEGFYPDKVTISCILKASSGLGASRNGQTYYDAMSVTYGIIPNSKHRTSMVDLYCRAGQFDKAMDFFSRIPSTDRVPACFAIMGACYKLGNIDLGELIFDHVEIVSK
ncbi:hypothetical protein KP509_28G059600 [Ceratopteris richardii]|uniref:Pentatricopeptide repeat-containing protein n=1 Tax=Ceratopteris richardii TaxID=49495 RepID=A0A8T2RF88_CERRI|nr:hypothetical protein KP509_28G059600 [Ceratopteris richardii]